MPQWDYRCPTCQTVQTFTFASVEERDKTTVTCDPDGPCDGMMMDRLPSAPAFKVAGFNAKNSYGVQP